MAERHYKKRRLLAIVTLCLLATVLLFNALFSYSYSHEANYRNVSVDTRVNITNARPELLSVLVDDPVTLTAGGTKIVSCNASIRDWNGGNTITNVTAVLYDNVTQGPGSPDDDNDHYTNLSCQNTSINGYYANFTCNFTVWYYANAGSDWICNVTVTDSYAFNESVNSSDDLYNTTTFNQLLALNVTSLIDYGNMAVGDTSGAEEANVTNFGNWDINVSVKGYGATAGDGLAFVCDIGNITVDNEKFSLNGTGDYVADYDSLSNNFQQIPSLTISRQIVDGVPVLNNTYWRLYVPPNPFGQCNGTVVFQAEAAN